MRDVEGREPFGGLEAFEVDGTVLGDGMDKAFATAEAASTAELGLTADDFDELAAVAEAEAEAEAAMAAERSEVDTLRRALTEQRQTARAAVERYRAAALAAEPALPPELVQGETLAEVEASLESARRAVAQVRERLAEEARAQADRRDVRGFPVGAPERSGTAEAGLTAMEKIARGLGERA